MSHNGYFSLRRGWRDELGFDGSFSQSDAWVWLVEHAAYQPTRIRLGNRTLELQRGECCFSVRYLADAWCWSASRVYRFLASLKQQRNAIETRTDTGHLVVTIGSYDEITGGGAASGTQRKLKRQQNRDKEEESNKEESKKKTHLRCRRPPRRPRDCRQSGNRARRRSCSVAGSGSRSTRRWPSSAITGSPCPGTAGSSSTGTRPSATAAAT